MKNETLAGDAPGYRLDQFLALRRPEGSRSHWKRLIEAGAVTVDGALKPADYKLRGGEAIRVASAARDWAADRSLLGDVVHEDGHLLVLNKPAGLLMHPLGTTWLERTDAALAEKEPNLAGLLRTAWPALGKLPRCGIVHRLDRQTSGVLLVAKTAKAQERLFEQFKEREVRKLYRAVVRGTPAQKTARVDAPIGRKPGHRKILVTPFGKAAETSFTVVDSCAAAAVVEARPLTGRTHQIRAHLGLIGHPVCGDVEFDTGAGPKPPRLMLHAYQITFSHPATGEETTFKAPLPPDMKAFWKECQKS